MSYPILETITITKKFGEHVAVNGLTLRVNKGSMHAVIGPNGAGKTTLFNLITGIYRPDEGSVVYKGKDITHAPQPDRVRMGLARCFQRTNILRRLSVFDNVYVAALRATRSNQFSLFGRSHGENLARDLADQVLAQLGLSEQRHREAQTIPYGDQRMLDVAMALACKPEVLLLDEMTSGLSAGEIGKATDIIKSLSATQTILLIEHNMSVVMNIADRITVINFGEAIAEGSPKSIRSNTKVQEAYFGGIL
jgi:branched-chain amino acid transport system ATP-binding protein